MNLHSSNLKKQRIAEGICVACGLGPIVSKTFCQDCLDKQKKRRIDKRAKGLCPCGQPSNGKYECDNCRNKSKKRERDLIARGICRECRIRPLLFSKTRCLECLAKCRKYVNDRKILAYEKLGGFICKCCGETMPAFLSIDHVNNDGAVKRKTGEGSGTKLFNLIIKAVDVSSWQILCMNCQMGRRIHGTCPHLMSVEESFISSDFLLH